jgi:type I restriction enzyme S subunit
LGNIAEGFQYGSSTKSQEIGKMPVLRMGNIQSGRISRSDLVYTSDAEEIAKYPLKRGDLLFNRTNSRELVGKTALFDGLQDAIYAGYLVRFTMLFEISPEYTNYVMNSKMHREWCDELKTDALGQSNLNATKLRDFRFPLPPLAEQTAIVNRVDRLLAMVDELEKQVSERKVQAEELMQAVLREAFEGKSG